MLTFESYLVRDESGDFETVSGAPKSLQQVGILELIEQDSRPTFVIDIQTPALPLQTRMNVVFCNKSLRFFDELRGLIQADTFYPSPSPSLSSNSTLQDANAAAETDFKDWATSLTDLDRDGYLPRHSYKGLSWTCATVRNRWRVISASRVPNQRTPSHGTPKSRSRSTSRSTSVSREPVDQEEVDLTKQLADSESKFKVLTELNPVGMYYLAPDGNLLYANDMWYEITGHPRGLEGEMSFMNVISEIDHPLITKEWELLVTEKGRRTFELRLRNPWIDDEGIARQKWIIASCDQEFDEQGNIKSIMGCITDISLQKKTQQDALERANLIETLALRTQEAAQHKRNFAQIAELAPCGMFTLDSAGKITWANSQWYEMTGHPRNEEEHSPMSFLQLIEQQDHDAFRKQWEKLTVAKEEVSSELRLKKPWVRHDRSKAAPDATWILFLALPQLDEQGIIATIFGCTTDISHFKWAEQVQLKSRLQAEEAKRQQENFIDMTS